LALLVNETSSKVFLVHSLPWKEARPPDQEERQLNHESVIATTNKKSEAGKENTSQTPRFGGLKNMFG
jgi:hypothetical protein